MSGIIEVLSTIGDNRQTFTVNTSVNDVLANPKNPIDFPILKSPSISSTFGPFDVLQPSDNFTILSIGISLPYNFVLSTNIAAIVLTWESADGSLQGNINVGSFDNVLSIPFANYELAIDRYIPYPTLATDNNAPIKLKARLITESLDPAYEKLRISMIGVPASLNTLILPITVFMKILHNLPLNRST